MLRASGTGQQRLDLLQPRDFGINGGDYILSIHGGSPRVHHNVPFAASSGFAARKELTRNEWTSISLLRMWNMPGNQAARSLSLQSFQFIERAWPVFPQQARKTSVRQKLAAGLTDGAVVGFVVGIADALNRRATSWARQTKATMHCHFFPKRGHFLREARDRFSVEPIHPQLKCLARCDE